jgi:hypothetical protein
MYAIKNVDTQALMSKGRLVDDMNRGGAAVHLHLLTSALDGRICSTSFPGPFLPKEITWSAQWTGGWVGCSADLEIFGEEETL